MVIVMNMGSAKILDEACNHYNETYRDEVLYTAWAEAPRTDDARGSATAYSAEAFAFMTRRYAGAH